MWINNIWYIKVSQFISYICTVKQNTMKNLAVFKSLVDMLTLLPDDDVCRQYLESIRWNGEPVCPHCGSKSEKHYQLKKKGEFKGQYK